MISYPFTLFFKSKKKKSHKKAKTHLALCLLVNQAWDPDVGLLLPQVMGADVIEPSYRLLFFLRVDAGTSQVNLSSR